MRKNGAISIVGILLLLFGVIVFVLNVIGSEYVNIIDLIFLISVVAFVVWLNVKAIIEDDYTLTWIKILMYIAVAGALLIDILHIADIGIVINLFILFISSSEITTMICNLNYQKKKVEIFLNVLSWEIKHQLKLIR
ncbi:hypothetical protein KCK34_002280 [Clostridium perfringens]|uniref:Uncharacterized protein n=1 Tax=Clostridium perfringens F262 TaxID=883064 RepID=A0AAV3FGZ1_CLOPF|nr:hypothetical protein [Clostridium perfringens]EHK2335820.1 hypothetical protein [Clostridium perfringens]EIA18577.1 hypothetical protein HA1_00718 [Clostridium perfringens F262]ELC8367891.1 hypothetical protein [Clostridium perfringens]MBO3344682.1 hypothetical protein [Clostridium perfringens]MBO3347600.1 hypothetical protein [Clostridium perfringens]